MQNFLEFEHNDTKKNIKTIDPCVCPFCHRAQDLNTTKTQPNQSNSSFKNFTIGLLKNLSKICLNFGDDTECTESKTPDHDNKLISSVIKNQMKYSDSDTESESDFYSDSSSSIADSDTNSGTCSGSDCFCGDNEFHCGDEWIHCDESTMKKLEPRLKKGYKRIYSKCGGYYDIEILKEGHERCNGCDASVIIADLQTHGANSILKYICNKCLESKKIVPCTKCGTFVRKNLFIHSYRTKSMVKQRFGDSVYCNCCKPPIVFTYNVAEPHNTTIEIPIPNKYEFALNEKYLFKQLAKKLDQCYKNIRISGRKCQGHMFYPAEITKPLTFDVTVENIQSNINN